MSMIKRTRSANDAIPTASMADIAFLLLVFFLTTTVFNEERGLPLVLPDTAIVDVSPRNVLVVHVGADDALRLQRGESELQQGVDLSQLEHLVTAAISENDQLITAVRAHPAARYQRIVDVLDAFRLSGATRVSVDLAEED